MQANRKTRRGTFQHVEDVFDECFDRIDEMFPDFGSCELHEDDAAGDDNGAGSDRQYAYCMDGDPMVIAFAPKASELSKANLRGLMRHEFGHALEYRYGVAELERRLGKLPPTVERRADAIAELVWGDPIVYDRRLVQCVGKNGVHPRPAHLPDKKEKLRPNGDKPAQSTADDAIGLIPLNQSVDYHGLRVEMLPSIFLRLARHLPDEARRKSYDFFRKSLAEGSASLAPSSLFVEIPEQWDDGDLSMPAVVKSHEGRHRAKALMDELGARHPIEVHVFPRGLRRRHLTPEWIARMNQGMVGEDGRLILGPLFRTMQDAGLKPNAAEPLIAYHGSYQPMKKPEEFREPKHFDWGPGFYLSTSPSDSIGYGSHLYKAQIRMTNPIVVDAGEPDPALFSWLKRAIRISDDDLAFYDNKMAGIFELYQTAVSIGAYKPMALADALKKKGYDGIIVRKEAILQTQPSMDPRGDYVVVWDPDQLETWEEVDLEEAKRAYNRRLGK